MGEKKRECRHTDDSCAGCALEEAAKELRFLLLSNGFWFDEVNPDPRAALLEGFRKAFETLKAKTPN